MRGEIFEEHPDSLLYLHHVPEQFTHPITRLSRSLLFSSYRRHFAVTRSTSCSAIRSIQCSKVIRTVLLGVASPTSSERLAPPMRRIRRIPAPLAPTTRESRAPLHGSLWSTNGEHIGMDYNRSRSGGLILVEPIAKR
jgi:hypothetical protein